MARLYRDLKVNEQDGKVYLTLYNRDGSAALRDVSVQVSSEVTQPGDNWTAAAANLLLRLDEEGQPQLALTPQDIGAAAAENGVSLYTHKKSGTVHTLTGSGDNIRFAATADFAAGDTVQVNGQACTAATAAGDALWSGFFKTGAMVVCYRTGNRLTFNGGGLPAAEAAKLAPGNLKTGVSITANGKTVTGTFTADANAAAAQILSGKTAYVKGQKVTGTLIDLGYEPIGTGCAMYMDWLCSYFGDSESPYIASRSVRIPKGQVASAIGLNGADLRAGASVLGITGQFVGTTQQSCVILSHQNYDIGQDAQVAIQQTANIVSLVSKAGGRAIFQFNVSARVYCACTFFQYADPDAQASCDIANQWVDAYPGRQFTVVTRIGGNESHGNNKRVLAALSITY